MRVADDRRPRFRPRGSMATEAVRERSEAPLSSRSRRPSRLQAVTGDARTGGAAGRPLPGSRRPEEGHGPDEAVAAGRPADVGLVAIAAAGAMIPRAGDRGPGHPGLPPGLPTTTEGFGVESSCPIRLI
jgi:hypothetical protein